MSTFTGPRGCPDCHALDKDFRDGCDNQWHDLKWADMFGAAPGLVDTSTAAEFAALEAEVERLRGIVAVVEALTDEWERIASDATKGIRSATRPGKTPRFPAWIGALRQRASDLRAALADSGAALREIRARAVEEAADEMSAVIAHGDVAEVAAFVPGEVGRSAAAARRDALYEEPHEWLRDHARRIREAP